MRRYGFWVALLTIILFVSCGQKKAEREKQMQQVTTERDSLAAVVEQKEQLIKAVFDDINAISDNLSLIKKRENMIAVADAPEGGARPVEQINKDIEAIDRLLQDNNKKLSSLKRYAAQLRKANLKIDGLEKMIASLNSDVENKRTEIESLRKEMSEKDDELKFLNEQVPILETEVENLHVAKEELENKLNTVYYIVGTEKELCGAQIVNKEGFIGRSLKMGRNTSVDSFTKADSRMLNEIPIGHKKVTVVSSHPSDSYKLITNDKKVVIKLVIENPEKFWESSKKLVVSYK